MMERPTPTEQQPLDLIDRSLREHLLAARAATQVAQAQQAQVHVGGPAGPASGAPTSPPANTIETVIPDSAYGMGQVDGIRDIGSLGELAEFELDGKRRNNRELSSTKRAAQNRAAQRAFRRRKDEYIKKLEEQVRDLAALQVSYKRVQAENYLLRDYAISLQSRLVESQGSYPQPPLSFDLQSPRSVHQLAHQPTAPEAHLGGELSSDMGKPYDGMGLSGSQGASQSHPSQPPAAATQVLHGGSSNERKQDPTTGEGVLVMIPPVIAGREQLRAGEA